MKRMFALLMVILITIMCFVGCSKQSKKLVIGATASPHAVVLEGIVKDILAEKGWELEVKTYSSYEVINPALASGALDANYFQHRPYLDSCNQADGTNLIAVCSVHYEPLGLYSKSHEDLEYLDGAVIAVPNDATNRARALNLLASAGIIGLSKSDLTVTVDDIIENVNSVEIRELSAESIPLVIDSIDYAVMNGNYAIAAGFSLDTALVVEDRNSVAADIYANVIAVREDNKDSDGIKALVEALADPRVKAYFEEVFGNAAIYNYNIY